jgi:hypothetical protein
MTPARFPLSIFECLGVFVSGTVAVRTAILTTALFAAFATHAQDAVKTEATTVSSSNSQPISQGAANSPAVEINPGTDSNLHTVSEISAEPRRFQYALRLTIRGVYDDNINITQTNKISDYYIAIEPAITLGFGDITGGLDNYIRLDYIPSILLFADHSENDAVQHLIHLGGQHRFGHLNLTMAEDIAILDGTDLGTTTDASTPGGHVNLDVSGRTRVNTFSTHLDGSYDLSGKTFLSSGFISSVTEYPSAGLISSEVFSENLFINYRYSDKLNVGIGGTAGYDFADAPTPDQTFEQANVHASYVLTGKINLNASGGVEFRQFENNSRGQYISPVFELGLSYQPLDGTSVTLTGSRRTYNSGVFAGQDFAGTTVVASLRQRLLQRVYLGVSGGYEYSDYFSTVSGVMATRRDNYYFVEPTLDVSVTRFWTVGAYYLHRQNDSSFNSFRFSDNQVGVRTSLTF